MLIHYLRHWLAWAESGAPHNKPYSRTWGLCCNIKRYPYGDIDYLDRELTRELEADDIQKTIFPFGYSEYLTAANAGTQHLNQNRLKWVREKINELANR